MSDAVSLSAVAELVVERIAAAPCAAVGAARRGEGGWQFGFGVAGQLSTQGGPRGVAAELGSLFDLASLTKPAVALTLARCHRLGLVDRDAPLRDVLPPLADTPAGGASLDLLSSHRAGLEAHRELFVKSATAPQRPREALLREAASARRPECQGAGPWPPIYSDLGYILLGEALSVATGTALDALVHAHVASPLGLRLGSIRQLGAEGAQVVPTEVVPWRGGLVHGVVHDENAWLLAGTGSSGHAGLFGDVAGVVGLGQAVLDALAGRRPDWLGPADLEPLVRRRPGGTHCAGFERRSVDGPSSGARFGGETFGHLGFTGTSIWLDPEAALVGVLLTNRVHPSRESTAIRRARPLAYDALYEAMHAGGRVPAEPW